MNGMLVAIIGVAMAIDGRGVTATLPSTGNLTSGTGDLITKISNVVTAVAPMVEKLVKEFLPDIEEGISNATVKYINTTVGLKLASMEEAFKGFKENTEKGTQLIKNELIGIEVRLGSFSTDLADVKGDLRETKAQLRKIRNDVIKTIQQNHDETQKNHAETQRKQEEFQQSLHDMRAAIGILTTDVGYIRDWMKTQQNGNPNTPRPLITRNDIVRS